MQLMVQARPNGRIMDHWRVAIGGSKILEVEVDLATIIPALSGGSTTQWTASFQKWPADVSIRRNMSTSAWADKATLIAGNQLVIRDQARNVVEAGTVLEALAKIKDKNASSASWRWAMCDSEAARMELQLQCLPVSTSFLGSKPIFKR